MNEKWYMEKIDSLNNISHRLQSVQCYVLENATNADTYERLELLRWTFRQMEELKAQVRCYEEELKKLRVAADTRETKPCRAAE